MRTGHLTAVRWQTHAVQARARAVVSPFQKGTPAAVCAASGQGHSDPARPGERWGDKGSKCEVWRGGLAGGLGDGSQTKPAEEDMAGWGAAPWPACPGAVQPRAEPAPPLPSLARPGLRCWMRSGVWRHGSRSWRRSWKRSRATWSCSTTASARPRCRWPCYHWEGPRCPLG